jgi:hypothetical protein
MIDKFEEALLRLICTYLTDQDKISLRYVNRRIKAALPFVMTMNTINFAYCPLKYGEVIKKNSPNLREITNIEDDLLFNNPLPPNVTSLRVNIYSANLEWSEWNQIKKLSIVPAMGLRLASSIVDFSTVQFEELEELKICYRVPIVLPKYAPKLMRLYIEEALLVRVPMYPSLVLFSSVDLSMNLPLQQLVGMLPFTLKQLFVPGSQLRDEHIFNAAVFAELTHLDCSDSNIVTLMIPDTLEYLDCNSGFIEHIGPSSSLKELNMSYNLNMRPINLATRFPNLIKLDCHDCDLKALELPMLIEEVNCAENDTMESLECPPSMRILNCNTCNISTLLGLAGSLVRLTCDRNNLDELDLKDCSSLVYLSCMRNNLKKLVVGSPCLKELFCQENSLTLINIESQCLCEVNCESNPLKSLSLKSSSLLNLSCNNCKLSSLDVSCCTQLVKLQCSYNELTSLDVSKCVNLEFLYCYNNHLVRLDVSKCVVLKRLVCESNHLETLVTASSIQLLHCNGNKLFNIHLHESYPREIVTDPGVSLNGINLQGSFIVPKNGVQKMVFLP